MRRHKRRLPAAEGLTYSWKSEAEWKSATIWKAVYKWMESSVTYFWCGSEAALCLDSVSDVTFSRDFWCGPRQWDHYLSKSHEALDYAGHLNVGFIPVVTDSFNLLFFFFKHGFPILRKPKNTWKLVWLHFSLCKIVIVYNSQHVVGESNKLLVTVMNTTSTNLCSSRYCFEQLVTCPVTVDCDCRRLWNAPGQNSKALVCLNEPAM